MTVHEFGKENKDAMLLIHPSVVKWDYFEYVIPLLEDRYHLIVPALPGYDFEQPGDFTSVEGIAEKLAAWCLGHGCPTAQGHLRLLHGRLHRPADGG